MRSTPAFDTDGRECVRMTGGSGGSTGGIVGFIGGEALGLELPLMILIKRCKILVIISYYPPVLN